MVSTLIQRSAASPSTPGRVRQTVYNVRDYGAVGDAATNDVSAINTAVAAAHAAGGGEVYCPPGTYGIGGSSGIALPSGMILHGAGKGATILKALAGFSANGIVKNADGTNSQITIEGLQIDGNNGSVSGCHNIRLVGVTTLVVRDVWSHHSANHGLWAQGATGDIVLDNCDLHDNTLSGMMVSTTIGSAVTRVNVAHCRADRNGRSGIDLAANGQWIIVDGNFCASNTLYGIFVDGGETPLNLESIIIANTVTGSQYGIEADYATRLKIIGNTVYGNSLVGINAINLQESEVALNHIHDNGLYGFQSDTSGGYTATPPNGVARDSNPTLYRTTDSARKAYSTPGYNHLRGNHIYNNGVSTPGPGVRIKNGQSWRFSGNSYRDTQVTHTQTYPVYAFLDTAPTFPAWVTATPYALGALVSDGGAYYQCLVAHTSSAAGATGNEPGIGDSWQTKWLLATIQPWATSTAYTTANWVTDGGAVYACLLGHTSGASTEPGVGASWQTYWQLKTVTLDGFVFNDNMSSGHTVQDAPFYAGTNQQVWLWPGQQGRITDTVAFLSTLLVGATWGLVDTGSAVNMGASLYPTNLLGPLQTNAAHDVPITLKRSATASGGSPSQRSSKLQLETSQWNGSAAVQLVPYIAANGTDATHYYLGFFDNSGNLLGKIDQAGLLTATNLDATALSSGLIPLLAAKILQGATAAGLTVAVNANAGTGASGSATGNDLCGTVSLTAGSGSWAAGTQLTVTLPTPRAAGPQVFLFPTNAATGANVASKGYYVTSTTTTFVIGFNAAAASATAFAWNYLILGG